jgi:deoxyuridine 5'-triphosphate nucleotidohydrolase
MLNYLLTHNKAKVPSRSRETSAAYDLYTPERHIILHQEIKMINTHFRCNLASETFALILGRSKLGANGLSILGGVIDSDYTGDWIVCVINHGDSYIVLEEGQACAQFVILPVLKYDFHLAQTLSQMERGESGILDANKN